MIQIEGDTVLVIGGIRCSTQALEALFLEPPKALLLIERKGAELEFTQFDTAAAAAEHFKPSDYRERVKIEKAELDERIRLLKLFIDSSPRFFDVPLAERSRMIEQHDVMENLSLILGDRIAHFPA